MQQADASDETAISGICERALRDEGRLDVFFANVGELFSALQASLKGCPNHRQALLPRIRWQRPRSKHL